MQRADGLSAKHGRFENSGEIAGLPINRSAAVLKASRSICHIAAAGLRHSRAPVLGINARTWVGRNFTPHHRPITAAEPEHVMLRW